MKLWGKKPEIVAMAVRGQRRLPIFSVLIHTLILALFRQSEGVDLEATLVAVDNSAYMINGDHRPNRLQCQHECVNLICSVKTQNPESTIGLMTMACRAHECPRVRVTPAVNQEIGPILLSLHEVNKTPRHSVQFDKAMKVGWMSLKHRMNKNQRPRIVAFVGSPLFVQDEQELVRWGRKLRKNNVAVDVVSFGESPASNTPLLQAFVDAVCKDGNSRLLNLPADKCPPGGLSDALFSSPLLRDPSAQAAGAPQPDLSEFGGVNPEIDPELAMALKLSAQEEKERREQAVQREKAALARSAAAAKAEESASNANPSPHAGEGGGDGGGGEEGMMDEEEAMFQKALELSLQESQQAQGGEGDGERETDREKDDGGS